MSFEPLPALSATASTNQMSDRQARDAAYIRVLDRMTDIGAELLRMVHKEAETLMEAAEPGAPPGPVPTDDLTLAYERISRGVRRNIMLAKKLDEPAKPDTSRSRIAARKRIIREVEDAIDAKARDENEAEALQAELLDRLDSPDLDDEIANRTIPEIVTDICRDFGITGLFGQHPWRRRMPKDIAILCARAAGLAIPTAAQVDKVEQQPGQQAQGNPAEPRTAQGAAQSREQTDTG